MCIFHGCKRGNGFPKHHCQDTVIVLKKKPSTPRNNKFKRENKTNQALPTKQTKNITTTKKTPNPQKSVTFEVMFLFLPFLRQSVDFLHLQVDAELVQSHREKI